MTDKFQGKPLRWIYINLDKRPDRRAHAEKEFATHRIVAERFSAFTPDQWEGDRAVIRRMMKRTPGAVGCYMSQLTAIKSCEKNEIVSICEDDVCFAKDMPKRLIYAEKVLPKDWDIFYLGATFHVPGEWFKNKECESWGYRGVDAKQTEDKHIMRVYGQWGTYAYFVNGEKLEKVLSLLEENCHRSYGIDHNFIQLGDKLNAFCFVPGMAWQYDNESNIGNGITEFSNFKKQLGPYSWTDYIEEFDPDSFDWENGGLK